jgi:hypothetical protein
MEKRLPIVCASLLEVRSVNTEDEMVRTNAEDIPSSLRLMRQNADMSEEQEADWNILHGMHHRREVNFVHRSAIDFLSDTVTGREILHYANLTDFEVCTRLLKGDFAAYPIRLSSLDLKGLIIHLEAVQKMFKTRLGQIIDDELQSSDILQVLHDHTMQVIALPQSSEIITEGDWLLDPNNQDWQFRSFLGFVMRFSPKTGQGNIFLGSRWALNTMKETDQSYKNYLLACAVRGAGDDSVEILLQHGADARSTSKVQRDAPAAQSSWSIALGGCLHTSALEGREKRSRKMDIITAFLNHHADLDEAVVQERRIELDDWRPSHWYYVNLEYPEKYHISEPGVTFLQGIKASDVVDFLQNAEDTATPEEKDSTPYERYSWSAEPAADALRWRYVAHEYELGFRLVGGRADIEKVIRSAWPPAVEKERIPNNHPNYNEREDAVRAALVELSTPVSGEEFLKYLYFRPEQTPDFQQQLLASLEAKAQAYTRERERKEIIRDVPRSRLAKSRTLDSLHRALLPYQLRRRNSLP